MTRILPTSIVMGVLVGLLVAAYMNIFNVPVMEWAIELEGCDRDRAGCAEQLAEAEEEDPLPLAFLTSLGVQRIGMSFRPGRDRHSLRSRIHRFVPPDA